MEIEEILYRQRELYLIDLLEFYEGKTTGAREVMIQLNNNESVQLFKLWRLDYLDQINGEFKPIEFNSAKYLNFEAIEYYYGEMTIELNPFYWNGCEFFFESNSSNYDWLIKWAKKWIDELETKREDLNGLTGIIHSVTKPELIDNIFSFSVDFGSAHTEAFQELINEFYIQNIKSVRIGSFSMID